MADLDDLKAAFNHVLGTFNPPGTKRYRYTELVKSKNF